MGENSYETKFSVLIAEVRSSNDVLHAQLKHLQELFTEKLDRIHTEYKTTNDQVEKHEKKIEALQEKLTEMISFKEKLEDLNTRFDNEKKSTEERFKKTDDSIDGLEKETELVRVEQKNPGFSKYSELGKLAQNVLILATLGTLLYQIMSK